MKKPLIEFFVQKKITCSVEIIINFSRPQLVDPASVVFILADNECKILATIDLSQFPLILIQDFAGNTDRDNVVFHELNPPINARYIRFRPQGWFGWISMRAELYGCQG